MYIHLAHLGVVLALLAAVAPLPIRRISISVRLTFTLLGLSGIACACAGVLGMLSPVSLDAVLKIGLPWLHCHQHLDPLGGFFFFWWAV